MIYNEEDLIAMTSAIEVTRIGRPGRTEIFWKTRSEVDGDLHCRR